MADVQKIIDIWELRLFILISIILQIFLIIWTYQRKRSSCQPMRNIFWLAAYMAANFTATISLGGIFHANMNPHVSDSKTSENKYLLALWAPFILLHLGGHSKMTAFSLVDNEFWLRHVFSFLYHEMTALLVCILASRKGRFRLPYGFLFIIGTVKFGERVLALKRGSMNELRSSTFKEVDGGLGREKVENLLGQGNPANRRGDVEFVVDLGFDQAIQAPLLVVHSRNDDVKALCAGYQFFNQHKGKYVDAIFMDGDNINEAQPLTDVNNIGDAIDLMKMELNFAHDFFYTKAVLSHTLVAWVVRLLSLISIISATAMFVHADKHEFQQLDVRLTYTLLFISLLLEVFSVLESVTSDYTLVQVGFREGDMWRHVEDAIRVLRNLIGKVKAIMFSMDPFRIGQYSIFSNGFHDSRLRPWLKKLLELLELKELWRNYYHIRFVSVDEGGQCMHRIFSRVSTILAEQPQDAANNTFNTLISKSVSEELISSGSGVLEANLMRENEESLLIWHIATDLCCKAAINSSSNVHLQDAKFLSEYMLYLLAVHPSMVSSLATTKLTSYRTACASSIQLFSDYEVENDGPEVYMKLKHICDIFGQADQQVNRGRAMGDILLLEGFRVASELIRISETPENINIWEIVFHLWVDLLCYAAKHCKGETHAEQLGTGTQFLTYVWLFAQR